MVFLLRRALAGSDGLPSSALRRGAGRPEPAGHWAASHYDDDCVAAAPSLFAEAGSRAFEAGGRLLSFKLMTGKEQPQAYEYITQGPVVRLLQDHGPASPEFGAQK